MTKRIHGLRQVLQHGQQLVLEHGSCPRRPQDAADQGHGQDANGQFQPALGGKGKRLGCAAEVKHKNDGRRVIDPVPGRSIAAALKKEATKNAVQGENNGARDAILGEQSNEDQGRSNSQSGCRSCASMDFWIVVPRMFDLTTSTQMAALSAMPRSNQSSTHTAIKRASASLTP